MFGLFQSAELLRRKSETPAAIKGAEEDELSPKAIRPFHLRVVKIDDACCQLDCVEPVLDIPPELPNAVKVDNCRVVNVQTQGIIIAPGIVSVRVWFDVVVTYIDGTGMRHILTKTVAFPAMEEPAKMVALNEADQDIHDVIVELSADCSLCVPENCNRSIRCVIFLLICIKLSQYVQIVVLAALACRPDECEPADTHCPEPDNFPAYVRRRLGL